MADKTHIIKRGNGWAVKREGTQRATSVYDSKEKAIESASKHSKVGSIIIIHKKDGTIQKSTTINKNK